MPDGIISNPEAPHPQHPLDRIVEKLPMPVRKLGLDLTLSAFFNACAFVSHTLPALVGSEDTVRAIVEKSVESFAVGTAEMAVAITAGRYLGGAFGRAVDKITHRTDDKYRKAFTAVGAVMGAPAYFIYESGIWAIPFAGKALQ